MEEMNRPFFPPLLCFCFFSYRLKKKGWDKNVKKPYFRDSFKKDQGR